MRILIGEQRYDEALQELARLEKIQGSQLRTTVLRAEILLNINRMKEGLAILEKAALENPKVAWVQQSFGLHLQGSDPKRAAAQLKIAASLEPKNLLVRKQLAELLLRLNRAPEAEIVLKEALALDAKDSWVRRALIAILEQSGRKAEAQALR